MKMAKSHTQKKYAKPAKQEILAVSNAATDYIKQWTTRELGKLQQEQTTPLCIPVKNGYRIGRYQLTVNPNKTCDVLDVNREFVHRFENKISAILYTIYTIKQNYWNADNILVCDREINKCYTDMISLRNTVEKARQRKDYVTVDTRMPRLEMAESRLNLARDKISKLHNTAKYYKIWE
jgi:hypothetical protein